MSGKSIHALLEESHQAFKRERERDLIHSFISPTNAQ
jgi:hypothetical protein